MWFIRYDPIRYVVDELVVLQKVHCDGILSFVFSLCRRESGVLGVCCICTNILCGADTISDNGSVLILMVRYDNYGQQT